MAVCLILTLLPATALAADDDGLPTASEKNFFANGTPITISESAPEDGTEVEFDEFTASGQDAYISWDEDGTTKYVGVSRSLGVSVYGGGDGSAEPVTVSSTSITMTGGKVWNVYGGNLGMKDKNAENCSTVTGDVTMQFSEDAEVWNLLHGGGAFNTCVEGTVYMDFNYATELNKPDDGVWPYINGGVYGNGSEGSRDIENGEMDTYAVVKCVEITATGSNLYLVGAGGSGSTKVLSGSVKLDGCTVGSLYLGGINGEVVDSSITATGCTIGDISATNRGFVGTGYVDLNSCNIDKLNTGAANGCFSSDSGGTDGSGVTGSCEWDLDEDTTVTDAQLTPLVINNNGSYTNTYENLTVQKAEEPLELKISDFVANVNDTSNTTQKTFTVPEGSTLTLNGVTATVTPGSTFTNAGTIDMDGTSTVTIENGATMEVMGTVNGGSVINNGTEKKYVARVGNVGYDSLQVAISAAGEKATVTLLQDTKEDINISDGKDIVLDLNGKTLTNKNANHTIINNGTLTIQDSSKEQTGTVDNTVHAKGALVNNDTCTINGGMFTRSQEQGTSSGNGGNSWYVIDNPGNLTVTGGTVKNTSGYSSLLRNTGTMDVSGGTFENTFIALKNDEAGTAQRGTMNITGGKVISKTADAVQNWSTATISDKAVIQGQVGTWVYEYKGTAYAGTTNITGGTVNGDVCIGADGSYPLTASNIAAGNVPSVTISEDAVVNGNLSYYNTGNAADSGIYGNIAMNGGTVNGNVINPADHGTITITGGTVTGQVTNSDNGGTITVTGGSFPNADVSGFVPVGFYTVTFNCAGGDPIPSQVVAAGTKITLPGCTHSSYHYKFDGWKCGNATYYADDKVEVNSNMTFTAQWKERFPDGPSSGGSSSVSDNEYAVTVDAGKHGDVSVSPKWAEEGDTVTITADPDNGYVVDEVIVTDKNGDDIRVRDRGDGEYTFTMPDSKVTVEVTFVEAGDELSFVDVAKSDYYYDAVKWAVENGVTTGVTDTIFAPGNPCTRAQTVTFLWRAAGMPQAANRVNPFTDVSVNDYYYEAVLWAVENGITGGTTATTFSPNATCTRAQVVTFLWRYSKEDASILPVFTDVAEGDYYYGAVAWAVENGVTTGVTDTSFVPGNPCTRGQIVTFLYRYMGK